MESGMKIQKFNVLGNLPPEIAQEISKFLTDESMNRALRCSRRWNYLLNYDYYWYDKCRLKGIHTLEENLGSIFYEDYLTKFSTPWKGIYMYHSVAENWKSNNFKSVVVNYSPFFKINHFDDEVLIATTNFNQLFVLDSSTGSVLLYYVAIYGNIRCVVRYKKWVIFLEEYFLCWKKMGEEGNLYYISLNISSYWDMMTSIEIHKNVAAVLDKNGLFVVRLNHLQLVYTNETARSVCFGNGILAFGTSKGTIKILNLKFKKLVTLKYNKNVTIWKIMIKDDHLVSFHQKIGCGSGRDYVVSVWSMKHQICLYSLKEKVYVTPGVKFVNQTLLLCLEKKKFVRDTHKIVFLDLNSGNYVVEIDSGECNLRTVTTNGHHVFTVSHVIAKMWCVRTKKSISLIDDPHRFFLKTFNVTGTKMAQIKRNGRLELRNYEAVA